MRRVALLVLVLCAVPDPGVAAPAPGPRKAGPAQYDVRSYGRPSNVREL